MDEQGKTFTPPAEVIDAVAVPTSELGVATIPAFPVGNVEGAGVAQPFRSTFELSDSNKTVAIKTIRETLDGLLEVFEGMKAVGKAAQNAYMYQSLALMAKEIINSSVALHKLDDAPAPGGKQVNHLHVSVTSDKMGELLKEQRLKKGKRDGS